MVERRNYFRLCEADPAPYIASPLKYSYYPSIKESLRRITDNFALRPEYAIMKGGTTMPRTVASRSRYLPGL
jgi:hypothetical protein